MFAPLSHLCVICAIGLIVLLQAPSDLKQNLSEVRVASLRYSFSAFPGATPSRGHIQAGKSNQLVLVSELMSIT